MKKLYRVLAEFEFFVVGDDDNDAVLEAIANAADAFRDTYDGPDVFVTEVTDLAALPKDWRESFPYGENETEQTCEQVLTAVSASRDQEQT